MSSSQNQLENELAESFLTAYPNLKEWAETQAKFQKIKEARTSEKEDNQSPTQVNPFLRYRNDPLGYFRDILGVKLTPIQEQIALATLKPPYRVMVESGHNVGKTFLAACMVNWRYDCFDPGVIITTAPTAEDVKDLLWTEIRLQRQRAGLPMNFIGPAAPEMRTHEEHWAKGYTAAKGESFQGRHRPYMFFVFDEAEGIEQFYWTNTGTMFKPDEGHAWLVILNPTTTNSPAYFESQKTDSEGNPKWNIFRMSCLDHPNISAEARGEKAPIPNAISLSQLKAMVEDWCERVVSEEHCITDFQFPPDSGLWWRPGPIAAARICGRRPDQGIYGVWSAHLWEACEKNERELDFTKLPEIGCFVAGTLIETETGKVPIENVKKGDKVLTRLGYRRVKSSFCTGIKPTLTLTCEDGRTLTGTGDHPVWGGSEWKRLDSLMPGDTVTTCKESNTTGLFSAVTRNQNGTGIKGISSPASTASKFPSTGTNGRKSTERFRKDLSSTTLTRTQPITTSATSNVSHHRSIPSITTYSGVLGISPLRGTRVKRAGFGTRRWQKGDGRDCPLSVIAWNVAINTRIQPPRRSFVQQNVNNRSEGVSELTTKIASVQNVEPYSPAINMSRPQLVPVRVRIKSRGRQEKVYNLTVEDCPEYFANGILVHNCDVAHFGDDWTVFHIRWGSISLHHESINGWDTVQTATHLKKLAKEWGEFATGLLLKISASHRHIEIREIKIKIDDDGVGKGVSDQLVHSDLNVIRVSAGSVANRDEDYRNKRSELWFDVSDKAKAGLIDLHLLPKDVLQRCKAQALAPTWKLDAAGRRVVEEKKETKKRIGRSPDDMDGINLAYCEVTSGVAHWIDPPNDTGKTMGAKKGIFGRQKPAEDVHEEIEDQQRERRRTLGR